MIIDLILDRRDGVSFDAERFYADILDYSEIWPEMCEPIISALANFDENGAKKALCQYIDDEGYNPEIKDYIYTVSWTESD